jgi:hypothetical protein
MAARTLFQLTCSAALSPLRVLQSHWMDCARHGLLAHVHLGSAVLGTTEFAMTQTVSYSDASIAVSHIIDQHLTCLYQRVCTGLALLKGIHRCEALQRIVSPLANEYQR